MMRRCIVLIGLVMMTRGVWSQELVVRVEAEKGTLNGVNSATADQGYSGDAYVTGFDNKSDYVQVNMSVPAKGLYELKILYSSPSGTRTQDLYVNNEGPHPLVFEGTATSEWLSQNSGRYWLKSGSNSIKLKSNWGYMNVDQFALYTVAEPVYDVATSLVDPDADEKTIAVYDFMLDNFGERVISGQTNDYYDKIVNLTASRPLMRVYDLAEYTEGYPYAWDNAIGGHAFGAVDNGLVEKAIAWHEETGGKGIVNWQWHWCSPSGGTPGINTFYTENTDFDIREAVKEGTQENTEVIRDIDAIAVQLKKLDDAGVPILWRPLHEAGGAWFWWGAHGPEPCLALWDIMYERLQNHHGLHNLIWVWSSPEEAWYPGNDKVDMIGFDSYPGADNYVPQSQMYDQLYDITEGKKIIAMTENGPIPDISGMFKVNAPWSMFMSWDNLVFEQNEDDHIKEVYAHWRVLTFDEDYNLVVRDEIEEPEEPEEVLGSASIDSDIILYPNPTSDQLHIQMKDVQQLKIFDYQGRLVLSLDQPEQQIKMAQIPNGNYLVEVRTHVEVVHAQLMIRH